MKFLRQNCLLLLFVIVLLALFGCKKKNLGNQNLIECEVCEFCDWVLINGVKWANRNVGSPGAFVTNPEDYGGYYQWNIGTTDFLFHDDYYNSDFPKSTTWLPVNDPSPVGYRVPTRAEIESLTNMTYVEYEWTTRNGVSGGKFTDRASGKCIFLPAAGCRNGSDGMFCLVGSNGDYWGNTQNVRNDVVACFLGFDSGDADWSHWTYESYGFSVRSVVE
ncbi:MAG: hypothetical protein LBI82_10670 [Dysgonamonadaceae bacterium]|jgi:hypothetical protein|nr:hypothetical protein [Dysgonamonadaceae bacterium]